MERYTTAIIGGGASGLFLASSLINNGKTAIFERGDRVGKKLSATGNGQGNVTNVSVLTAEYFTQSPANANKGLINPSDDEKILNILQKYDNQSLIEHLRDLGVLTIEDERGRVYPAGRQASAVTDALRFYVAQNGVDTYLQTKVCGIERTKKGFILAVETPEGEKRYFAENVVLCAGGKAAKNFGTDGSAYALAQDLGHTVTDLFPSLVQLKTDVTHIKTLKGIRVNDGKLTAQWGKDKKETSLQGDIIFTDYGVSGDAVFRISAFISDELSQAETMLTIDFLPDFKEETIYQILQEKQKKFPNQPTGELLCGVVNNQIGRAILKRANNDLHKAATLTKAFSLSVKGTLGFDYAQVTKGGIPLQETDENLQSNFAENFYLAGEILDVDGQCGGFNLQWAYSSARVVAAAIDGKQNVGD